MTNPADITMGFEATGEVEVSYGPHRLRVAEWAGKPPEDVTGDDVARYEAEQEGPQL